MTLTKNYKVIGICVALLALSFLLILAKQSSADVAVQQTGNANNQGLFKTYNFFATSTNQQQLNGANYYGTTTVATGGAANYATSTNIYTWVNNSGQIDYGYFVVAGASQVALTCAREATSTNNGSTSCIYQVQQQPNGQWQYFNQLTAVASTTLNLAGTTYQNSIVATNGTTTVTAITSTPDFYDVRCIVNITEDGVGLCSASARW